MPSSPPNTFTVLSAAVAAVFTVVFAAAAVAVVVDVVVDGVVDVVVFGVTGGSDFFRSANQFRITDIGIPV